MRTERPAGRAAARTATALVMALIASMVTLTVAAGPAAAAPKISVSQSKGLDPDGQRVTVSGSGFNERVGIYVALCVDRGAGATPTPCLGGVDMSGESGSSAWISSNPPPYGEGLAEPYGPGGSFSVTLTVKAKDVNTDCTKVQCVLATRADHTAKGDTSQLTRVPVAFATEQAKPAPKPSKKPTKKPAKPTKKATPKPTQAAAPTPTATQTRTASRPTPTPTSTPTPTPGATLTPSAPPTPSTTATAAPDVTAPASPEPTQPPAVGDEAAAAGADLDAQPVSDSDGSAMPWVLGVLLLVLGAAGATFAALRLRRSGSRGA
jgi:hypothetical protein